jgi:putative hydrolase of the HAD superfamily
MEQIKNIIFDLGGVIINLDVNKTIAEFNKISNTPFESVYTQLQQKPIFDLFDKGLISENDFFEELQIHIKTKIKKDDLIFAWNAMLLDFPVNRLNTLTKLNSKYRLFLLSNTNETHVSEFENQLFKTHGYKNLDPFFEKVYYSCRMKMRKPDLEIFESVLKENNLIASETLFIDDTNHHVIGAQKAGINSLLLAKNKEFEELLIENGML